MSILQRIRKIVVRRCPWEVHFNYETRGYNGVWSIIRFLFGVSELQYGRYVMEYQKAFAELLGDNVVAYSFGAGRMALYAILEACEIGEGDEVLVPAFTCEVVVHALMYRGIRPVYVDIDPNSFNIDCDSLIQRITSKARAIIAQHTFGIPCDMDRIRDIAVRHGLLVIEDCALSLGANYKGRPVGTMGDAAIFSTDVTKVTSTVLGGMAVTTNPTISERLRYIYQQSPSPTKSQVLMILLQAIVSKVLLSPYLYYVGKYMMGVLRRMGILYDYPEDKETFQRPVGYPCRMSNWQCFLGMDQLRALDRNLALRRDTVKEYTSILNRKGIRLGWQAEGLSGPVLRFSLLLKDRQAVERRACGCIELGKWFDSPVQGWYEGLERIGYCAGSCPSAEAVTRHVVNLPTHQTSPVIRRSLYRFLESLEPADFASPGDLGSGSAGNRRSFSSGTMGNNKS